MALAGTGTLVRLALRRDRIRLPAWIVITIGLVASTAASIGDLYDDPAQRQQYAETAGSNPASVAISGPGFGLTTVVALVSMMLVVRHRPAAARGSPSRRARRPSRARRSKRSASTASGGRSRL